MSNIQNITESFKGLSVEELLTIIAAATAEAKKSAKVVAKAPKEGKKRASGPKDPNAGRQLLKPRAWVEFVLAHGIANGWPAITVKDKEAALPASVEKDGKHVFEETGKPLNNKHAMSLSKQYWSVAGASGSKKELYDAFEAQYVEPALKVAEAGAEASAESDAESEASVESAPKEKKEKKVKKTEEEKQAEKEAKALAKAQEKEAEKVRKAAEKEAEKQRKAAEKAAPKEEKPKEAEKPREEAPKPKPVALKLKKAAPKVEELPFDIEADEMVHEWVFQGKKVYVNSDGEMWARTDSDETGPWMGKYDPSTKVLDASASEPLYADDE